MSKKTIMIFGVSSFLGSNFAEYFRDKYRVIGTYMNNPVDLEGILTLKCDINNKDLVTKLIVLFKPDVCLYTVGLRDLVDCDEFPKLADALNTAGVFNVSQVSEAYKIKFIYFSSCFVFTGMDVVYRENDSPVPLTVYGNTSVSSEFYIQKTCLNYLIFRCAPVLGRSLNPRDRTWIEMLEQNNYFNQNILADTKIYTGYIDIWSLMLLVQVAIERDLKNRLFHLSSPDIMNRYDFGKLYMKIFNGNSDLVVKSDWKFPIMKRSVGMIEIPDHLKFQMSIFNVESEFDLEMPTIEEMLEKTYKTFKSTSGKKSKITQSKGVNFI